MKPSPSPTAFSTPPPDILSLLDFCKGLAIAWIVLFHYRGGWFGWQGVHIFIVLSSFGLTYSCLRKGGSISWKQWYLRRIERILPSYWLVCLLSFLALVLIQVLTRTHGFSNFLRAIFQLFLDSSLLKNVFSSHIILPPNYALWFVPFIISFYLIFPWLYHQIFKEGKTQAYLSILLGAAAVEFVYRALAIYLLDGSPIGYEQQSFLGFFPVQSGFPLVFNKIPDKFIYFFQFRAPFGLFLSRIAEFILGMIGAIIFVKNYSKFVYFLLGRWAILAGIILWSLGNLFLFVGLWGWIFADFVIALGLILCYLNLAAFCQRRLPFLFLKLSQLGDWSYYIFLTHSIFLYVFQQIASLLSVNANPLWLSVLDILVLVLMIVGTAIASSLVMQFDQSRFANLMIEKSVASWLK